MSRQNGFVRRAARIAAAKLPAVLAALAACSPAAAASAQPESDASGRVGISARSITPAVAHANAQPEPSVATAQEDWHTTQCTVDLREGGTFRSRMEAKDGSMGFDFEGTYTRVVPKKAVEYRMSDGREVQVELVEQPGGVLVKETFDAETENPPELQRQGWQAILDNFGRYVEAKG